MTTIIIVVVVALVFFVSLCVVTFMVWKREEEMRTDSLKSIESNLQELGYRMTSDLPKDVRRSMPREEQFAAVPNIPPVQRQADPFEWTRADDYGVIETMPLETKTATMQSPAEPMAAINEINKQNAMPRSNEINKQETMPEPAVSVPEVDEPYEETDAALTKTASAMAEAGIPDDLGDFDETLIEPFSEMSGDPDEDNDIISDEEILEATAFDDDEVGLRDDAEVGVKEDTEAGAKEVAETAPETDVLDELAALENMTIPSVPEDNFEINLEGLDVPELDEGYFTEYSPENIPVAREPMGFDVGRSGRKYTAEELDMLIKE